MTTKASVSLRGLRTFCKAAAHENFSTAAAELFITPSAVSHQIKSLEEELGLSLFERTRNDLRLTGVGRELFEEVRPLIEQIEDTVAAYRTRAVRSSVQMSVQPFFASEFFVPRLGEFTDKHPTIDIRVKASDESAETHPGDVDLSIRLFRSPPRGVESQVLMPLTLAPAGSRTMAKNIVVEDGEIVSDFPIIIHESYPRAWQQWSDVSGIALPKAGKVTRLDSMIAVVRAVEQGIGAALVPVPIAEQWFRQKTIVRLFDDELVADVSYHLIWHAGGRDDSPVELLKHWILERFCTLC